MFKAIGSVQQNGTMMYQLENANNKTDIAMLSEADLKLLLAFGYEINGSDNLPLSIGPRGGIYGNVFNGIKPVRTNTAATTTVEPVEEVEEELEPELETLMDDYPQSEATGIATDNFSVYKLEPDSDLYVIYDKNKDDFVTDENDEDTLYVFNSTAEAIDYAKTLEVPEKKEVDLHIESDEDEKESKEEAETSELYNYLTNDQEQLLQQYYMWFSRRHFEESYKDPLSKRLGKASNERSKDALERKKLKLDEIHKMHSTNGKEHTMVYGGYIDNHRVKHYIYDPDKNIPGPHYALNLNFARYKDENGKFVEGDFAPDEDRNAYCSVGHAIRFMHIAWDIDVAGDPDTALFTNHRLIRDNVRMDKKLKQAEQEGKCIIFGCSIGDKGACLGDFFGVDSAVIDALHKAQMDAIKDMKILLDIYKSGKVVEAINSFKLMDEFIAMTKPKDLRNKLVVGKNYEGIINTPYVIDNRLCEFYQAFRDVGMVPPKTLVQEIRQSMIGWTTSKFTYAMDKERVGRENKYAHLSYPFRKALMPQLIKLYGNYAEYEKVKAQADEVYKHPIKGSEPKFLTDLGFTNPINKAIAALNDISYFVYSKSNNVYSELEDAPYLSPFLVNAYLYIVDTLTYKVTGVYEYDANNNKDEGGSSSAAKDELRALRNGGAGMLGIDYSFDNINAVLQLVAKELEVLDTAKQKTSDDRFNRYVAGYNKATLIEELNRWGVPQRYKKLKSLVPDLDTKVNSLKDYTSYIVNSRSIVKSNIRPYYSSRRTMPSSIEEIQAKLESAQALITELYAIFDQQDELLAKAEAKHAEDRKVIDEIVAQYQALHTILIAKPDVVTNIVRREDNFGDVKKSGVHIPEDNSYYSRPNTLDKRIKEIYARLEKEYEVDGTYRSIDELKTAVKEYLEDVENYIANNIMIV